VTEVLALYYSSYGRIEHMASPDLVSFATPYIANWDLAERLRLGAPLAEPGRTTLYDGNRRGYPDYPSWHWMA
jgi:2,4-dienoyl-CoA reductase-like NADH-dependent reductase (Old Yellow Enzyme family)